MEPYYDDGTCVIYHGDCREMWPDLDADADVVVTDPPYGVGMKAFVDSFETGVMGFEESPGKRAAVFHSPRRTFEFVTGLSSWRFERVLWMHKVADIAAPWRGWCMNSEAIMIFSRTREGWPVPADFRPDVYTVGPWERAGHPNGKPLSVVTDLINRLAASNDLVLDPFMGSGTTLRAAKDLGRKAIGIEIEERYCEIAAKRLAQEVLDFGAA